MISSQTNVDAGMSTFKNSPETVGLPPVRSKYSVSQKHEVNPALAFNLLKDIQSVVSVWHEQLRQVVDALHALHAQGPMVDGWLESSVEPPPVEQKTGVDSTILRHGDVDVLLQYVEALDGTDNLQVNKTSLNNTVQAIGVRESGSAEGETKVATTTYRLCYMNEDGQVMSQPCPPMQMGMVSMAIARYRKFRQLTSKKQAIEAKLQRVVYDLASTRSALKDSD